MLAIDFGAASHMFNMLVHLLRRYTKAAAREKSCDTDDDCHGDEVVCEIRPAGGGWRRWYSSGIEGGSAVRRRVWAEHSCVPQSEEALLQTLEKSGGR